ncbi:uncharacterized protein LY89DRAFT_770453 [Mollisia scopiformis]|uniref:Uncharacterized protein n=1 Tax=Mollisia scopiformis TaxID=149040 RepID=A0A194XM40_MOLSC|nr:uncharacterized protein LY89DRAFT_770453 [Mollisia scopiformis]KUJ21206.1 hypothetical protein LY89DRAFT_770453 [Mollisia scopiformis]
MLDVVLDSKLKCKECRGPPEARCYTFKFAAAAIVAYRTIPSLLAIRRKNEEEGKRKKIKEEARRKRKEGEARRNVLRDRIKEEEVVAEACCLEQARRRKEEKERVEKIREEMKIKEQAMAEQAQILEEARRKNQEQEIAAPASYLDETKRDKEPKKPLGNIRVGIKEQAMAEQAQVLEEARGQKKERGLELELSYDLTAAAGKAQKDHKPEPNSTSSGDATPAPKEEEEEWEDISIDLADEMAELEMESRDLDGWVMV